jgi:hypothetical protein
MELRRGLRPADARPTDRRDDNPPILSSEFHIAGKTGVFKERLRNANTL